MTVFRVKLAPSYLDFSGLGGDDSLLLAVPPAVDADLCRVSAWAGDGYGLLVHWPASQYGRQARHLRMRYQGGWGRPRTLERALLPGGRPLYSVRRGSGLHDAVGGHLP